MEYLDRVYGKVEITEPVILDLINSPSLQRLKNIDQSGYFEPYFPGTAYSRFEHSLGVYALLSKYDASLEERIAGLIYDASHTVFSHCIDYAFGSGKIQDFQDNTFQNFIRNSDIPHILSKYAIDPEFIIDDANFPLKEKNLPDLCADRIDNVFRNGIVFNKIVASQIQHLLTNLKTKGKEWAFRNLVSTRQFTDLAYVLNNEYISGINAAVMLQTTGDYLKYAFDKNYISKDDFYLTDEEVLRIINQRLDGDIDLKKLWSRMNNTSGFENNPENYDVQVFCKSRVIDPLFESESGGLKRLSDVYPEWKKVIKEESEPKEYFIKFGQGR